MKIETSGQAWSGVRYAAGDRDWRGYQYLNIELYNVGEPFMLNFRIDDGVLISPGYGDRYNGRFKIDAGANTILIPLGDIARGPRSRLLALDNVRKMILFLGREEAQREFYLDGVHLIP